MAAPGAADGPGGPQAAPLEESAGTYTVHARDTLWNIAERLRPDATIGTREMAEALFENNPHAFDGGMDRLLAGAVLHIPAAVAQVRAAGSSGARPPQVPAGRGSARTATPAPAEAPDDDARPPQRGFTFGEPGPQEDATEAAQEPSSAWDLRTDDVLVEAGALASSDRPVDTTQYARAIVTASRPLGDAWELQLGARGDLQAQHGGPFPRETRGRIDYDENYLRYRGPDSRITLGTQRILWGRVDEIPPTDRLSTKDLTRFGLDAYADRRRANPAVRVEYFQGPWHADFVLLPVFREAELPDRDSLWHPVDRTRGRLLGLPDQPALAPVIRQARLDDNVSGDGGGGLRLSRMGQGVDFALTLQRARHSEPYYRLDAATRQAILSGSAPTRQPVLEAVHPRTWVVGGDVAFVTGAWTWRAEAAWLSDVPATRKPDLRLKTTERFDWVIGSEVFPGDGDFRITTQLSGQHLLNAGRVLDFTRRYFLTGELETPFSAHAWRARLRYSLGLDHRDVYANPELAWIANEPMEFYVGAHWLDGSDSRTAGGFYRNNRMLVLGWRGQF